MKIEDFSIGDYVSIQVDRADPVLGGITLCGIVKEIGKGFFKLLSGQFVYPSDRVLDHKTYKENPFASD